jgi:hypothetical protein
MSGIATGADGNPLPKEIFNKRPRQKLAERGLRGLKRLKKISNALNLKGDLTQYDLAWVLLITK